MLGYALSQRLVTKFYEMIFAPVFIHHIVFVLSIFALVYVFNITKCVLKKIIFTLAPRFLSFMHTNCMNENSYYFLSTTFQKRKRKREFSALHTPHACQITSRTEIERERACVVCSYQRLLTRRGGKAHPSC